MRRRTRRGGALVAALATLAFSAALAAALADLVRTEVQLTSRRRTTARLLAAADACLAEVVAALPAAWDFGALLAGADGTPGTADDGVLSAPDDCTASARPAPGAPLPLRAVVRASARVQARGRRLDAVVAYAADPGAGALLWLAAAPTGDAGAGTMTLDGSEPDAPLAALAAPADPDALDAWIAAAGTHLRITPGTAEPIAAPPPPLPALGTRVLATAHAGAEALAPGGPPIPLLAHVAGDLAVDDVRQGAGLLFVDGTLEVRGTLAYEGVLVATGGLRVAAGGSLTVDGTLWLGAGAPALLVDGTLTLRRMPGAVAVADGLLALPRRAVVASARDLG